MPLKVGCLFSNSFGTPNILRALKHGNVLVLALSSTCMVQLNRKRNNNTAFHQYSKIYQYIFMYNRYKLYALKH